MKKITVFNRLLTLYLIINCFFSSIVSAMGAGTPIVSNPPPEPAIPVEQIYYSSTNLSSKSCVRSPIDNSQVNSCSSVIKSSQKYYRFQDNLTNYFQDYGPVSISGGGCGVSSNESIVINSCNNGRNSYRSNHYSCWDDPGGFISSIYSVSNPESSDMNCSQMSVVSGNASLQNVWACIDYQPEYYLNQAALEFAKHLDNPTWMNSVFKNGYNAEQANIILGKITNGDRSWFPSVTTFAPGNSSASIKGVTIEKSGQIVRLDGAYKDGVIYWNDDLIGPNADRQAAKRVAIQELAHHIDSLVNPYGTHRGGEGIIALSLINESGYTNTQLQTLQKYNDHFDIHINNTTYYDAELGFKEWAIGIGSVVAIVATFGLAAPEVAVADAALIAGDIAVTEGVAEGAAIITAENAVVLEEAGAAIAVAEGAAAPTLESLLGVETFTGELGAFTSEELAAADSTLEQQGYRFVGYHGTNRQAAISIVNNGIVDTGGWAGQGVWDGFYIADEASTAAGYTADSTGNAVGGQLLRVYLPSADAEALQNITQFALNEEPAVAHISDILGSEAVESGNFIFRGAEAAGNASTETIMGWQTASRAVVIPSSIQVSQNFAGNIVANSIWEAGISTPVGLP